MRSLDGLFSTQAVKGVLSVQLRDNPTNLAKAVCPHLCNISLGSFDVDPKTSL